MIDTFTAEFPQKKLDKSNEQVLYNKTLPHLTNIDDDDDDDDEPPPALSLPSLPSLSQKMPVRRLLGDLLNPATWPEVLRRFAMAHLRYSRALFSRHGRGEWLEEGHPLPAAVEVTCF